MGAEWFEEWGSGPNVNVAFKKAVKQAQYDYGHAGYTGTLAEKDNYNFINDFPEGLDGEAFVDYARGMPIYGGANDERRQFVESKVCAFDNKWGPAGAVEASEAAAAKYRKEYGIPDNHRVFIFFGWASS